MPYKSKREHDQHYRDRHQQRKELAFRLLGGYCARCGEEKGLEVDHIDPSTKSFTFGKRWMIALDKFLAELDKCQLLCRPCHQVKTAADRRTVG